MLAEDFYIIIIVWLIYKEVLKVSEEVGFLERAKKKFGNSLEYHALSCVFTSSEISLDALFMRFRVSKEAMYSIMRNLEGAGFVESITYLTKIFYKIKK